jgi:membrane protease YdiL (CAAX protease family)
MNEQAGETRERPSKGQVRRGAAWAFVVFLAQIPFVIWWAKGQIPIHPAVIMLPLIGLLNTRVEKRGPEGLGLAVVQPLHSLLLALLYASLSLGGWLFSLHLEGGPTRSPVPAPHPAWTLLESLLVGVFVIALWEEMLNRGYVQTRLQQAWGFSGLVVSALLFATMHIPTALLDGGNWVNALLRFAQSGVCGFALGYVYWCTGSLLATIAVHGLNNLAVGVFLLRTGFTAEEMLYHQPAVQLLWLIGQAGLVMLLARAFFKAGSVRKRSGMGHARRVPE